MQGRTVVLAGLLSLAFNMLSVSAIPAAPEEHPAKGPEDSQPESEVLERVKALVRGEDWRVALDTVREFRKSRERTRYDTSTFWENLASDLELAIAGHREPAQLLEDRGRVATRLELHETALEQYARRIGLLKSETDIAYARDAAARSAEWVAAEALLRIDYRSAAEWYERMAGFARGWMRDDATAKAALARRMSETPGDAVVRMEFAKFVWVEKPPPVGRRYDLAVDLLVQALEFDPPREQRLQVLELAQVYALEMRDMDRASDITRRIREEFAGEAVAYRATFQMIHYLVGTREGALEARGWLDEILQSDPPEHVALQARSVLAFVHEALGDEESRVRELERMAEDAGDGPYFHFALKSLGWHHLDKGRYAKALEYLERWMPDTDCGNCTEAEWYGRDFDMARCLRRLGREQEALDGHLLKYLSAAHPLLGIDDRVPALVVEIHESRGELEGLVRWLEPHAADTGKLHARLTLDLARTRREFRSGDIAALIARLDHDGEPTTSRQPHRGDNPRALAAATALSGLGGRAFAALKAHYEAMRGRLREETWHDEYDRRLWTLYALGLSPEPEARTWLEALAEGIAENNARGRLGVNADDIGYALTLREKLEQDLRIRPR